MAKKTTSSKVKIDNDEKNIVIKSEVYNNLLEQLNNKWEHHPHTDEELKDIAKALYHNKIFSNLHMDTSNSMTIGMVFMPLFMMGSISWPSDESRESKVVRLLLEDKEVGYKKRYRKWLNDVGFIYEYYTESMPRSVNGMPIFSSCRFMSKSDAQKMIDLYNKYKEIQDNINTQF